MISKESIEVQKYKSLTTIKDKESFIKVTKDIKVLKLAIKDHTETCSWIIRKAATENYTSDVEILQLAINDEDWTVRKAAVEHPKSDLAILKLAINDTKDSQSWIVRQAAVINKKSNLSILIQGSRDEDSGVKEAARLVMLGLRNKAKIKD